MTAKILNWFLILLVLMIVAAALVFLSLPSFLIIPSQSPKVDAIVDLSIDSRSKADAYIAWLYRYGVVKKVVTVSSQVSHQTFPSDYARDHLISLGLKREDVYSLHLPILDCRAKVLREVSAYAKGQGWNSVLIICQPEDSWGYERVGDTIFKREGIEYAVGYAPEDDEDITTDWYREHWKVQRFVDEALSSSIDLFYSECR